MSFWALTFNIIGRQAHRCRFMKNTITCWRNSLVLVRHKISQHSFCNKCMPRFIGMVPLGHQVFQRLPRLCRLPEQAVTVSQPQFVFSGQLLQLAGMLLRYVIRFQDFPGWRRRRWLLPVPLRRGNTTCSRPSTRDILPAGNEQ